MWDVFFSMEGQLGPDEVTYTIMFRAIKERDSLDTEPVETITKIEEKENRLLAESAKWDRFGDLDDVPEETLGLVSRYFRPVVQSDKKESVHYKNAADARLVWEHLTKANQQDPNRFPIAASHISLVLDLLAKGKPSDHLLAFDILHQYVDLEPPIHHSNPSSSPPAVVTGKLPITNFIFSSVLELCVRSARAESCIKYFQIMAEKRTAKNVINWKHMISILRAFAMRRAPKGQLPDAREAISALEWMLREQESREREGAGGLKPGIEHFVYALTAAWKAADMSAALRVVELMTGLDRQKFMGAVLAERKTWTNRDDAQAPQRLKLVQAYPKYSGCTWNTTCMALLIKTAGATQKKEDIRIALRILNLGDPHRFFGSQTGPLTEENIAAKNELAKRTIWCIDYLLNTSDHEVEMDVWKNLRRMASDQLKQLTVAQVRQEEHVAREKELKQMGTVEDGNLQLLVSVKGQRSRWATGMNTIKIGGPADNVGPDTSQNPSRTKRRPPSARHSHSGVGNPFSATSQEINSKKSPEWTPTAVQAEDDRKAKHRDQKANPSRSGNKVTRDKALFPVDDVALILLDMQDQYRSTVHEFPSVLSTTLRMIRLAKLFEIPVISLERNATNQNRRVREIDTVLDDSFHLFWNFRRQKTGGYIPEVVSLVNMWFKRTIIIVGLEVHTSVLQTALKAFEQGRVVYVVADGVSSRNREEIPVALEFMRYRLFGITHFHT
ncbi:hypothetical protein FRC17_001751 [Serendipita sp. 399]|nr:hypothetical protein FRC17_001751 [Serendipita sp. 399]